MLQKQKIPCGQKSKFCPQGIALSFEKVKSKVLFTPPDLHFVKYNMY